MSAPGKRKPQEATPAKGTAKGSAPGSPPEPGPEPGSGTGTGGGGRSRQRFRTRKALLQAAVDLVREGRRPAMEEVADRAHVSRATAYRYFPNLESLLVEAPLDGAAPTPEQVFADDNPVPRATTAGGRKTGAGGGTPAAIDAAERVDRAEAALHAMVYQNEAQLRLLLAHSLNPTPGGPGKDGERKLPPLPRQNRRTDLIEAALAPARDQFDDAAYERLCQALALLFGPESMVVFRDVVPLSERRAREVKRWMIHALVEKARQESGGG